MAHTNLLVFRHKGNPKIKYIVYTKIDRISHIDIILYLVHNYFINNDNIIVKYKLLSSRSISFESSYVVSSS